MSLRAIVWALEEAPVDDPQAVLVLIALADRANSDGTAAFPSHEWISQRARCSVATVKRRLTMLEQDGLICRGDQGILAATSIPANRRPIVWNLDLRQVRVSDQEPVRQLTPDTLTAQPGQLGSSGQDGRQLTAELQTVLNHPEPSITPAVGEQFETWWTAYPRKTAKANARKAFVKAIKKVDPSELLRCTEAMASDVKAKGTEERFIPHGATWLNGERWQEFSQEQLTETVDDRVRELMAEERYDELARLAGVPYVVPVEIQDMPPGVEKKARREEFRRDWRIAHKDKIRAGVALSLAG